MRMDVPSPRRVFISVAAAYDGRLTNVIAVDDLGRVWRCSDFDAGWERLPNHPDNDSVGGE